MEGNQQTQSQGATKQAMIYICGGKKKSTLKSHLLSESRRSFDYLTAQRAGHTLLAEAFPLCFSALYCHSLRGFGCSRFVLAVSGFLGTETTKTKREQPKPRREWQYNAEKHKGKASAGRVSWTARANMIVMHIF